MVGASGAVFGIMFAFARYWPTCRSCSWVLPAPCPQSPSWSWRRWRCGAASSGSRGGVADFAHLGGFVGGWLYLEWLERRQGVKKFRSKTVAPVGKDVLSNYKRINPTSIHEVNRDEVNRILDKISAKGLSTLTAEERLFLSNFVPPDDRVPPPT